LLHAYQPPNISDAEIEQMVRCVYQPVLALHTELGTPLTLNVQGCLLQRLQMIAPGFVEKLRALVRDRLVELTTSAHYHPCLPLFSRDRRQRQIALNLQTVEQILHVRPVGFWPPELAWSPAMAEDLVTFDLRWTIVDGSALVRAWSRQDASGQNPAVLYHPAELMQPYLLPSHKLIAVPRQHDWSRRLLEEDALLHADKLYEALAAMRMHARGLICLATDAERLAPETLRLYEWLLHAFADFSDVRTPSAALVDHPPSQSIDLPVWSWRGALDQWVRGEGERSFLRELDDAYLRRAHIISQLHDANLTALEDSLMRAESSCWLFWCSPCRFLAEGFAQIERANRIMDPI
jgi:alpha-amylase/alpha-mannosidase (GH57 family)